ncbi:glycoside hydrolase family 38 C-terminal domain-containing protein [uncultured Draconibacterium sp.]|uniref:alpha-mannosidase n=1 Tax=uncultured Draconibacterium sp. TaxID=1573823 RepID=UPI0029C99494|nr:glycoside hydrolase family 38 C-terminal domain-containing protein [uncultured Draconibacterium sp.]
MNIKIFFFATLILPLNILAQPLEKQKEFNIAKDKVLYTVAYSHLDSEWKWDYPETIDEFILKTMTENFSLFERYPEYVFSFTGSRRYQMMKEYYPDLYAKVKDYVGAGRWHVSGSSVDEGEVNVSSSESLIRQVLYGNDFFKKEFGKESYDYMLPDCFGFLANAPSIWHHCGLLGFSTQKLTWNVAVDLPFNVGVWNGPDGKGIIAALNATKYTGKVEKRLDKDSTWNARLDDNYKKYGISFDYRYYGIGDQGGGPRENDVRNAIESLNNPNSDIEVVLAASDQMYKDITPEIREKLPTYSGDLLLIEHSAGTQTSQSFMKRINRKNENLAKSAEQLSCIASALTGAHYPQTKLNNGWNLVLGSQMHDILPGTSIPVAYNYAWNDEFIASNGFSESLKGALSKVSSKMNTQAGGRAITVYNPVAKEREDVVAGELKYQILPKNIRVLDSNGKVVASQIISTENNKLKFLFLAKVPSLGMAVFDVQETNAGSSTNSKLIATSNSIENEYYKVIVAKNGDISSVYDKKQKKELLLKPAGLEFQYEKPEKFSAWNMDWNDRKKPPIDCLDSAATIKISEDGPVRVALEVTRQKRNSKITQLISLAAGNAGKRVEIANKINWRSTGVSLKAAFPLTADNEDATYNIGVGTMVRNNNHSKKFEVPSKEWFNLTDASGKFGISVLEDCKYGSDKPDNNTLRLTLMYSPHSLHRFGHQASQDWGIHDVKYGLYSHKGSWQQSETPWQAKFLNNPLVAFEAPKHVGKLGASVSFLNFNKSALELMAFKKAENSDYFIVRINEMLGKDQKGLTMNFNLPIENAYEVNGQEQKIGDAEFSDNALKFDISHFTIRSFAIKFTNAENTEHVQQQLELPFTNDVVSFDRNRHDGDFIGRRSYPAELFPSSITSEDITFKMGATTDEALNVVSCKGQTIQIPSGNFSKVYLLAASNGDSNGTFKVGGNNVDLSVQSWTGFIGQHYNRIFAENGIDVTDIKRAYVKDDNIAWFVSHTHKAYSSENQAYQYCYIYKYEVDVPIGAKSITLPDNDKIKVFAITVAQKDGDDIELLQPIIDDFEDHKEFEIKLDNIAKIQTF